MRRPRRTIPDAKPLRDCAGVALSASKKRVPVLRRRPGLEVLEGDIGELAPERGAIEAVADPVEPSVHLDHILAHPLPDDVERDLGIVERPARDAGEDGGDLVARKVVAPEIEALAGEAARILKEANGDGADVRDGDLGESAGAAWRRCPS